MPTVGELKTLTTSAYRETEPAVNKAASTQTGGGQKRLKHPELRRGQVTEPEAPSPAAPKLRALEELG